MNESLELIANDNGSTAHENSNLNAMFVRTSLRINNEDYELQLDPRTTVLDLLRERLRLTGTKKGCNHGQCGACTVLVNGERVNSCLALAVCHDGDQITTIEGLTKGDGELHPMQAAFLEHDGFQCGYCTPGQICSAIGMLAEFEQGTVSHVTADVRQSGAIELSEVEIRERMSGNLCRCGAYNGIVAAIQEAVSAQNLDKDNGYTILSATGRAERNA